MRLHRKGKALSLLSSLLVAVLVFVNSIGVATAAGKTSPHSFSSAKAVEIDVLPGLEGLGELLDGLGDTVGGLLGGLTGGLLGTGKSNSNGESKSGGGLLGGLVGGLLGNDGLLGGVLGTVGGLLGGVGGVLSDTGIPLVDTLGGVLQDPLGTVNNLLTDPVGTVTGLLGAVVDTVEGLPLVGDILKGLPLDLDALAQLRLGPTKVEVGITKSEFDGTDNSYGHTYPLALQLLGQPKLIPIDAKATRVDSPKHEDLLSVDLGVLGAAVLTGDINVTDESATAIGSVADLNLAGLITVGAVQTATVSAETYAESELLVADVNVANIVKIKALHAKARADLINDPYVQIDTVKLNVLGKDMEIQIGDTIEIPGIVRLGIMDGYTVKENGHSEAHGGVLEIELLGAVLGGITVRIGAVDASVTGEPGAPYNISKKALADTVEPGGVITYNIVYSMNYAADDVQVTDELPDGTTFVEASDGGKYDEAANKVVWNLGDLKKDDGGVLTLKVRVNDDVQPGTIIRNVAVISAPGHEPEQSNTEQVQVGAKVHIPFVIGFPDGTFRPNDFITRAQIATIVARILELQHLANSPVAYVDVKDHWAKPYIAATTAKGIFRGSGAMAFNPDRPASRAELAVTLVRMHEINPVAFAKLPGSTATFKDVSPNHWAYNEIETAVRLGFLQGYADGTFRPDEPVTRAEVCAMLSKALGRGPLIDGKIQVRQHFPDVPRNAWFFGWVEEAAHIGHKGVFTGQGEALEVYLEDVRAW